LCIFHSIESIKIINPGSVAPMRTVKRINYILKKFNPRNGYRDENVGYA
jgi:hypothetical protein